ncbi:alpha-1,2-mannosyltransferase [Schizosaccharomyces cryophilus OY26]|uniref:Mannosyltransferase n=1 Tax=Schizosaccharomyces cryophilus (strain OY26 / ATCC MYA-4695 / CBS 11777 / NBRC 106824 / NRRL Y48691) TaxID=653667 RepID=S9XA88_SCHCR|nr:alpha-1,2-mannosyltransferase [Schizosaccharomyces cryophilus OY26]EPY54072.1 alpha-1,2-mannosyltransferase [Schizosaccharomyces cryophilus OY26]
MQKYRKYVIIYAFLLCFRLWISQSNSYIHPDEQLQSLQIIAGKFLGWKVELPWEFTSERPIRSIFPLYIMLLPAFYTAKVTCHDFCKPDTIFLLARFTMFLWSLVIDFSICRIVPPAKKWKSLILYSSSFLASSFQTHTITNSMETVFTFLAIMFLSKLAVSSVNNRNSYWLSVAASISTTIGMFTRITFLAFVLVPYFYYGIQWLKINRTNKLSVFNHVLLMIFSCALVSSLCLYEDYKFYGKFTVTPFNNIMYNSRFENLALHGIHSKTQHLFVNVPLLCGPLLLVFPLWNLRKAHAWFWIFPVLVLSIFPHQEARFLLPAGSLYVVFAAQYINSRFLLLLFIIYSTIMSVFYGIMHQNGVVPSVVELSSLLRDNGILNQTSISHRPTTIYYWRTYTAPTWMLALPESSPVNVVQLYNYSKDQSLSRFWDDYYKNQFPEKEFMNLASSGLPVSPIFVCPVALLQSEEDTKGLQLLSYIPYHVDLDDADELPLADLIRNHGIGIYTAKKN